MDVDIKKIIREQKNERVGKIENESILSAVAFLAKIIPEDAFSALADNEMFYKYSKESWRHKHSMSLKNGIYEVLHLDPEIRIYDGDRSVKTTGNDYCHCFRQVADYSARSFVIFANDDRQFRFYFKDIIQEIKNVKDFLKAKNIPVGKVVCIAEHVAYFCQKEQNSGSRELYWHWCNNDQPAPSITFHMLPIITNKLKSRLRNKINHILKSDDSFQALCLLATLTSTDAVYSTVIKKGIPVS